MSDSPALHRKKRKLFTRRNLPLHLLILPAIILVFIYKYLPMAGSVIAFQNFKLSRGIFGSSFVGLDNFRYIFNMPDFFRVLRNTLNIALGKMILNLVVPVVFALLLNEVSHSGPKRLVQTALYLPYFLSWIILAGLFTDILSTSSGILNKLLGNIGLSPIPFLTDEKIFPVTIILTDVWKGFGYGTIVYLASLNSIDPALYESAMIDGANRWQQTIHITLPGLSSIVVLMALLSLGSILSAGFDQVYNMLNPLVKSTGEIIDTLVYTMSVGGSGLYGPSTALGLMNSLVSFLFVSTGYILADKYADYKIF